MPLAICGVHEVPQFSYIPLNHIISIRDKTQPGPNLNSFIYPYSLHSFIFDDTGNASNTRAPNEETIKRLLSIYHSTSLDQSILFHCFAGVSRSTAAAFIYLVHHKFSYENAYEAIVIARGPFVCPNQLMVKYADNLMGHQGKMQAFLSAELGRREPERAAWFNRNQ